MAMSVCVLNADTVPARTAIALWNRAVDRGPGQVTRGQSSDGLEC